MTTVNIDSLAPWELSLTLGGKTFLTCAPTWGASLKLAKLNVILNDPELRKNLESDLRDQMKGVVPPEYHDVLTKADYDSLIAAFSAVGAYWEKWLKKKLDSATKLARGEQPEDTSNSGN